MSIVLVSLVATIVRDPSPGEIVLFPPDRMHDPYGLVLMVMFPGLTNVPLICPEYEVLNVPVLGTIAIALTIELIVEDPLPLRARKLSCT